jgi:penicillin amidase
MDAVSLLAREALPVLNALPRGTGALGTAQGLLADWDGEIREDLPQPLIWNAFMRRMPALALRRAGIPTAPPAARNSCASCCSTQARAGGAAATAAPWRRSPWPRR